MVQANIVQAIPFMLYYNKREHMKIFKKTYLYNAFHLRCILAYRYSYGCRWCYCR